jgi:aryl-alcohol dehydrogenase-like predicted oxidoreductase
MPSKTELPTRRLGSTDIDVSVLGFGGAVIGIEGYLKGAGEAPVIPDATAIAAIDAARAGGINFFDTAPGYGAGRSEDLMGRALEPYRSSVYLATKVAVRPGDHAVTWQDSLEQSLKRLRTGCVDLLQLHGSTWSDDAATWVLGEPLEWLMTIRDAGLARWIGITAEAPSGGLERLLRSGRFDVLQIAYNVIYQSSCDYQRVPFGVIPLAKTLGMGTLTMRTTTSGVLHRLLRREFPDLDTGRISRLAIRFVLSTPEVDCALVGMGNAAEVADNCALARDLSNRLSLTDLHDSFATGRPTFG